MTTVATRDLIAAGEAIEEELADDIRDLLADLPRYGPGLDSHGEADMGDDPRGDYLLRDDVLDAVTQALR